MTDLNRYGEDSHPPFRSQRLFSENGQWYFDTREGRQVGPYQEYDDVKKALAVFLAQKLLIINENDYSDSSYVPGSQDGVEHMVEEIFEFFHQYKLKGKTGATSWAKQRLRKLYEDKENPPTRSERMEAIRYALELDN